MTAPEAITVEIQKLEPSAIVEMFEVDATAFGGDMLRFHAGTNQLRQNLVWQGETYSPFPIQASGFDYSGNGQLPRPKLAVANVTGAITLLVLTYDDLLGAKVTRKRTLLKYLDAVNFPGGTNPTADPAAEFGDEIFFVDRKTSENRDIVEFELAAAFDVAGVRLPRRQVIQNVCTWKYRGGECGYTGTAYFNADDQSVATVGLDVCGKRLSSCKARFGANEPLPFGSFPAAGLTR
jgi:lambda family phage minor tail protein L